MTSIRVTSRWSRSLGKWRNLRNDCDLTLWLSLLRCDNQTVEAMMTFGLRFRVGTLIFKLWYHKIRHHAKTLTCQLRKWVWSRGCHSNYLGNSDYTLTGRRKSLVFRNVVWIWLSPPSSQNRLWCGQTAIFLSLAHSAILHKEMQAQQKLNLAKIMYHYFLLFPTSSKILYLSIQTLFHQKEENNMIPNQNMGRNKIITTPYLLILEPRGETCKRIVCFRKKAQPTSK